MGLKPCSAEHMLATVDGFGPRRSWFPRIVAEAFLESTKDGEIARAPDAVTMIDGDLAWSNDTGDDQAITVQIIRSARAIVAQSPVTVLIHDAWTKRVGKSPVADYPSISQDCCGGRVQVDRPEVAAADLKFGRFYADIDASQVWVPVGVVPQGQAMHFRYRAAVQTPGTWTAPSEFEPRWEAHARYARLLAFATPVGSA